MKQAFTLLLLLQCFFAGSQTKLLKKYDFSKGGYSLVGIRSESDPNALATILGNFYTDDVAVLEQFKTEWVFKEPSPAWSCGYHYIVYLCKNGLPVETYSINLNCKVIATNSGYFLFDARQLEMFKGKLKRPVQKHEKFNSLSEARDARLKMLPKKELVLVYSPEWVNYDGSFRFTYPCKNKKQCLISNEDKILALIKQEISKAYPGEVFELDAAGSSDKEVYVEIKCSTAMSKKFKLYPLDNYYKWEPCIPILESFWKQ